MARLPTVGGDDGTWGTILNEFLEVSLDTDGKLKNMPLNVKDYGATGDGTTDDSTAINNAITAAGAAGGNIVFVPEGTYIVQDITMRSNVILRGAGRGSILKLKDNTTADVIKSPAINPSTVISYAGVEDLTIDGNKANQSDGVDLQQYGLALNGAADSWARNVWVHDTQRSGIYLAGERLTVEDCQVEAIGKVGAGGSIIGRSGIVCSNFTGFTAGGMIVRNNRVLDCLEHGIKLYPGNDGSVVEGNYVLTAEERGIYIQGGNYVTVTGNTVNGAAVVGIFIGDGTDAGVGNAVGDNTINGITGSGAHGILCWNQFGGQVTGNGVTNCTGNGIYLLSCPGFTLTGNRCHNNGSSGGYSGIKLYESPNSAVVGNICSNNGTTGSRGAGIYLTDAGGTATTNCSIVGNICYDTASGGSKKQAYGVLTDELSDYITVDGNTLRDNFTAETSLVGTHNVTAVRQSTVIGPFYVNDLQATASPQMNLGFFNSATAMSQAAVDPEVDRSGRVIGLTIVSDDARTSGTCNAYVRIDGVGSVFAANAVVLNGTHTTDSMKNVNYDSGLPFTAGQRLGIDLDTSGWGPTTANIIGWLTIAFD